MQITPFDPNETYYVIIGCGFSAILNHVQLVQSAASRIQSLTILHIGLDDPWLHYRSMPMGQWPSLLSLPGYRVPAVAPLGTAPLDSKRFADRNQQQWAQLGMSHPSCHLSGKVTSIDKKADIFRIYLDSGIVVKGSHIDICGGPGPSRNPSAKIIVDLELQTEFETRTSTTGTWPRLTSGEGFLSDTENRCDPGSRVCIYGGGPTAAWCVESAQRLGCDVVWLVNQTVNDAFVSSGRNDHLVAETITRTNVRGDHVVTGKLTPRSPSTRFGEYLKIDTLHKSSGHRIEVKVSPKSTASPRWVDTGGTVAGFIADVFDQVVCAIGQKKHHKESQSWAALVRAFILEARRYKEHLIKDADGRAVGLKNRIGTLRILGAAALNHRYLEREWNDSESPSYSYYRSLVEQARVPVGIALAANAVAAANNFVLSDRPPNINMCSLAEMDSGLGWLVPDFAVTAFATRGVRTIPHTEQELYEAYRRFWSFFY